MKDAQHEFDAIKDAIGYIESDFRSQPDLETIATRLKMSPFHFQRLFTKWAGTSPKKFLQYVSLGHAKKLLTEDSASLLKAAHKTGLSGTSRLHDLFVSIEGMTPGEYKRGGENLTINYSFADSPFGRILIASTTKGIAHIAFADDEKEVLKDLHEKFPNAAFTQKSDSLQKSALSIFSRGKKLDGIKLHLKGTPFQLKVWEALLRIPAGHLSTYSAVALRIKRPNAQRAVGTAVGRNPVAFLIPCHRVIRSTGVFGNYHWGSGRKKAMIGWEAARSDSN
ncbi:cysteine methyltransferase [Candidatus Kaiserbacteria bacterium RIFCSPHIGHO2_01_FULL_56_24]|uniref:Cysteine methyltransferase n=1 Tax=Candidatus Kaiserbacteria bacterium RIFCSPHIGHO2_01_FULL_56_24 TaxID=1798487 RepID=A0A1F6DGW8_9BACT|nr:MAG: cysteine methyltransferase [Candidatus Kaiserbacteria bacterium RIFCSPHIGHO2_01_FULL_56_24]